MPQGSILGPLSFLIYIDDIATVNLTEGLKIVLYADDILLYHPISSPEDIEHLQNNVDKFQACASANYMTFNASKCKFMPHLEYAALVWSPHLHKDITILEKIQQFASKMCTKIWDCSYTLLIFRETKPAWS